MLRNCSESGSAGVRRADVRDRARGQHMRSPESSQCRRCHRRTNRMRCTSAGRGARVPEAADCNTLFSSKLSQRELTQEGGFVLRGTIENDVDITVACRPDIVEESCNRALRPWERWHRADRRAPGEVAFATVDSIRVCLHYNRSLSASVRCRGRRTRRCYPPPGLRTQEGTCRGTLHSW